MARFSMESLSGRRHLYAKRFGPRMESPNEAPRGDPVRVLLLAEAAGLSLQVVMCLAQMGAEVHALVRPGARQLRWSRHCRTVELFDFHPDVTPIEQTRRRISELAVQHDLDVAVPVSTLSATVLDRLRTEIPLRCFPIGDGEAVQRLNDKWSFDGLCRVHGVNAPRTLFFAGRAAIALDRVAAELGFPLVVKPANLGDRVGVVIARSAKELRAQVIDNPAYNFERLVVQAFVPGRDLDLNVLAIGGVMVAHSTQVREGRTVVFTEDDELLRQCARIIAATKYDGLAHFDAIRHAQDGSPWLLECNARAWGSIAASAFCGLNFIEAGIAAALDRPLPPVHIEPAASFLTPPHAMMRGLGLGGRGPPLSAATRAGLRVALRDPIGTMAVALTPSGKRLPGLDHIGAGIAQFVRRAMKLPT